MVFEEKIISLHTELVRILQVEQKIFPHIHFFSVLAVIKFMKHKTLKQK